jgi:hypothetical protein
MKKLLFLSCVAALAMTGCYNDKYEELYPSGGCDITNVTYSGTISKITAQSCSLSGCHDASTASSGVVLDSYSGVKAIVDDGRLMKVVKHENGVSPMPQNAAQLDACTISKLQTWVDNGAQNN